MGLPGSEDSLTLTVDDRLSSFDTIPACDGQTDVQPTSITCAV